MDDFAHYLHLKRWTHEDDRKRIENWPESYQKMWVESALYYVDQYENQHPEWKILGDKEHKEFWDKSISEANRYLGDME